MASKPHYEEVLCRTAMNRVQGMGFRWSLNPYRGCVHGCHYCFARRFHSYFDLDPGNDFTGVIFVKTNISKVLSEELSRRSWRRETVTVGTATDPYQPIEGEVPSDPKLSGGLRGVAEPHKPDHQGNSDRP